MAFSPDGRTLAAGGEEGATLWDAATKRERTTLMLYTGLLKALAFSPDGRILATGSRDTTLRLWDVGTHEQIALLTGHNGELWGVAFSPDGRFLASAGGNFRPRDAPGELLLWEVATRRLRARLPGHTGRVHCVAFSPDGRLLASAGAEDRTVILRDVATGRERRRLKVGSSGVLWHAVFSPDGRTLATCGGDQFLRLFDVATGHERAHWRSHTGSIRCVAFSPDGRRLAACSEDATVSLWDLATRRQIDVLLGHRSDVQAIAFTPDGKSLASASFDTTVKLWETAREPKRLAFVGHTDWVNAITFSPDGTTLATAGSDGTARRWRTASRRPLPPLVRPGTRLDDVAYSPDGKTLATVGGSKLPSNSPGDALLWDAVTGKPRASLRGHTGHITSVAFSPTEPMLATGSEDQTARLWDATSGRSLAVLRGHEGGIFSVAFSPDGKTLASCGPDRSIKLWDVPSRRLRGEFLGHASFVRSIAFSPDGRTLASGSSDRTVRLWDLTGRRDPIILRGHGGVVGRVAFSPDGMTLASTGAEGMVKLWNSLAHREVATFRLEGLPQTVAFSPDGRLLAVGEGNTISLWRAAAVTETDPLRVVGTGGDRSVTLSWQPVGSAVAYRIYREASGGARATAVPFHTQPATETSFVDRSRELINGRSHRYTVAALFRGRGDARWEGMRTTLLAAPIEGPPGFLGSNINEGIGCGTVHYDPASGEIRLSSFGRDVSSVSDSCYFLNRALSGDWQITVRQTAGTDTDNPCAKAGLMVRQTYEDSACNAFLTTLGASELFFHWRPTPRADTTAQAWLPTIPVRLPITLRLTRTGATIQAEYAQERDRSFRKVGDPLRLEGLSGTVYAGIAITSHDRGKPGTATFRDLTIQELR